MSSLPVQSVEIKALGDAALLNGEACSKGLALRPVGLE
jgi:hypothetical protein